MKRRLLVISYYCMVAGSLFLLAGLILQSANSQEKLNMQRFVNNGLKTEVVVVDKKIVINEFVGTLGVSRKDKQFRVYVKAAEQPLKVYWQALPEEAYNGIGLGNSLTVYINKDEIMIADLIEVSNVLAAWLVVVALLMFAGAIICYKKSSHLKKK